MTYLGKREAAALFGVDRRTITKWMYRTALGQLPVPFPAPDVVLDGHPAWKEPTLVRWGKAAGREPLERMEQA